jgi:paraquat-inducible protein A
MTTAAALIACHECDLLQRELDAPPGTRVRCARCGALLYRMPRPGDIEQAIALLAAALVLFVVANTFPILTMEVQGSRTQASVLDAVRVLWDREQEGVAVLVLLTGFLLPLAQIVGMLAVLLPFHFRRRHAYLAPALRLVQAVGPWSMTEVFMLGVLVSLVKLVHLATVVPGVAMWAYFVLIFVLPAAAATIDVHTLWKRMEALA